MKVIYDETKAMESASRFQKAERKLNAAVLILGIIGIFFGPSAVVFVVSGGAAMGWGYASLGLSIIAVGGIYWARENLRPKKAPDAIYYMAAQGKKVLDVEIKRHGVYTGDWVFLIAETADGDVEHTPICRAEYRESTKVKEPTFDAHNGIVYVPYKWWKAVLT